jgi:hypothetical protein
LLPVVLRYPEVSPRKELNAPLVVLFPEKCPINVLALPVTTSPAELPIDVLDTPALPALVPRLVF